jgi:hypothetical protein
MEVPMVIQAHAFLKIPFPIDDRVANVLLSTALQLEEEEGDCRSIDRDFMYGKVTSTSKRQSVGTIVGQLFVADIETERGHGRVEYLVAVRSLPAFPMNSLN